MEAGLSRSRGLLLVLGVVLLLRLPFLNQAIQGDDDTYLSEAEHALVDPLHPAHTTVVFQGVEVDLRGHPHPPLDAWILAGLLAVFGDVKEVPFHAAYMAFSMVAAVAMWSLARRFSPQPVWACLLFLAVPAFVVTGNSLESDLPFLACWMSAMALFCAGRVVFSGVAMGLAAMAAYQAVFLTPILAVYVWLFRRQDRKSWAAIFVAPAVIVSYQLFERFSTGRLPAAVLTGYFATYGFQSLDAKLRNAAAMALQFCLIVFPALLPVAVLFAWRKRREREMLFLLAWIGIFFAGAVAVFFAGAARYLLPLAAPVALLASRLRPKWLAGGVAAQMALGLGLAAVNYQHWDACRRFAAQLRGPAQNRRAWVDGELGLRYYMTAEGALPLEKKQRPRAGDLVVTSELTHAVDLTAPVSTIARMEVRPLIPLRLIGIESHSGFSTVSRGLWPFGVSESVIDRLRADLVLERRASLQYLPLSAPESREQIVDGIYPDRWMGGMATVVLKSPAEAAPLEVSFFLPPQARGRRVTLRLDGREVASGSYTAAGAYTLKSGAVSPAGATATVEVEVDRTFSAPPDQRALGVLVSAIGFVQ